MSTIYLIIFMYVSPYFKQGGPAIQIMNMPDLKTCEIIAKQTETVVGLSRIKGSDFSYSCVDTKSHPDFKLPKMENND